MAKVIVFEKSGEVKLATLIDDQKGVCRENFTGIVPCSEDFLNCFPSEIIELNKAAAPMFLYFNSQGQLESLKDYESV